MATAIIRSTLTALGLFVLATATSAQERADEEARELIQRGLASFTGDLPEIRSDGIVRVLTVYERNCFFVERGVEHGFEVEQMRAWVKGLNKDLEKDQLETQIVFIPLPLEQLLPALLAGHGDVVAANLTITSERQREVAFAEPYLTGVKEIVVSSNKAAPVTKVADLAGRRVFVTRSSSYADSLRDQSTRLVAAGAAPIEVVEVDATLQSEDLIELVNAGVIELTVCDGHIAKLWAPLFPDIRVHADVSVSPERSIAWAVRPTNPLLLASLSAFAIESGRGTTLGNVLFERYYVDTRWIRSPLEAGARERFDMLVELFRSQTEGTGFDWLQIAAQAFQESGLDPKAKSSAGALGLMQLTAATAKEMGCLDRTEPTQNVAAGVKYMVWLRDKVFAKDKLEPGPLFDFCLAAYNAGPGRVEEWRKHAGKVGLDPDRWFGNVEHVALDEIGRETVRYVGNVNKYYFAYRMSANLLGARTDAFDKLDAQGDPVKSGGDGEGR